MAAKKLGVTQQAVNYRILKSPTLKAALNDIRESTLDLSETKLIQNIKKGDNTAIIFYLKCHGKNRGYVERQKVEISGDDKKPINLNAKINLDDELKKRGIPIPKIEGGDL